MDWLNSKNIISYQISCYVTYLLKLRSSLFIEYLELLSLNRNIILEWQPLRENNSSKMSDNQPALASPHSEQKNKKVAAKIVLEDERPGTRSQMRSRTSTRQTARTNATALEKTRPPSPKKEERKIVTHYFNMPTTIGSHPPEPPGLGQQYPKKKIIEYRDRDQINKKITKSFDSELVQKYTRRHLVSPYKYNLGRHREVTGVRVRDSLEKREIQSRIERKRETMSYLYAVSEDENNENRKCNKTYFHINDKTLRIIAV